MKDARTLNAPHLGVGINPGDPVRSAVTLFTAAPGKDGPDSHDALARWVSIVGHPFVLTTVIVTMSSITARSGIQGLPLAFTALALVLVPCGLFALWKVRTGAWQNLDVSSRRQRPVLYALAMSLTLLLLIVMRYDPRLAYLERGMAATLLLLALCLLLNGWIKVSMHAAFCTYMGMWGLAVSRPCGLAVLAAIPLICWARVRLGRHTLAEVQLGVAAGLGIGLGAIWV